MLINRDNIKFHMGIFFFIFASFVFAQETHNLEIIWQKGSPDSVFYFGRCIASGDVNGDSFSDIMIVGDSVIESPPHSDSCYRGRCWIFFGGINFDTISDIRLNNLQKLTFWSLHSGDINGDGFDDIILGACNNARGYGEVLVFLGGNPMDSSCDYVLHSTQAGSCFGCAIATGDVNGDSYSDLIVGAYGAWPMPGGYDMGRVYIYYGGANFDTVPDVILNGGHNNDREGFGTTVSGAGDVNKDGFSDIIISAGNFGLRIQGRVYIYFGGNPMDTIYDVALSGERAWEQFGWDGVDFLVNQMDYDYAIIGSALWNWGSGSYSPGRILVLFGGPDMDSVPDVVIVGRTDSSRLGCRATTAGFTLRADASDLLAGAPIEYNYRGTAYLWLGGSFLDTTPDAWIRGMQGFNDIGGNVASAGDVDGDRKDEIMVCNTASMYPTKVWICKYTGQGIEENRLPATANRIPLEVNPNPCNRYTAISYSFTAESRVSLKVYNITGKVMKTLNNRQNIFEPGNYEIRWDLRDNNQKRVATGIYFIEVTINAVSGMRNAELRQIRKITVIK